MKVVFKQEEFWNNEPIGTVLILMQDQEPFASRPIQPQCGCGKYDSRRLRATETNEWGRLLCPDCGSELPLPWVTIDQAERVAGEHGCELEVL